jgi:hypothetical protein
MFRRDPAQHALDEPGNLIQALRAAEAGEEND